MKHLPDMKLYTVKHPISVHGNSDGYDQTEDYATISLYIPSIKDGKCSKRDRIERNKV